MDTKTCTVCGKSFTKPATNSRRVWEARQFCSRACFHQSRRSGPTTKRCEACGGEFARKRVSNAGWSTARYCSQECAYASRTGKRTGEEHWAWKGGRHVDPNGYVHVRIDDDHPYASMRRNQHYILEHRLVMAEHLGRPLRPEETIHHVNGDRTDNRLENLELYASRHPKGQRVEDLREFAKEILELYPD